MTLVIRRGHLVSALAATAALGFAAPAAQAAFSPALGVTLDNPASGKVSGMRVWLASEEGDTPVRDVTIRLPGQFSRSRHAALAPCPPEAVPMRACGRESLLGTASTAIGGAPVTGELRMTGAREIALLLDRAVVPGRLATRPDGDLDLSLRGLPALSGPLVLSLRGAEGALFRNPRECARYLTEARFISQRDEFGIAQSAVRVTGCDRGPRLSRVHVASGGSVLTWRLSRLVGGTRVRVERLQRRRWHDLGSMLSTGFAGRNVLRFDGVLRGRALRPARYRFVLEPRGGGKAASRRFTIR